MSKEEVSSSKKYDSGFPRKKEGETNAVSVGRQRRPHVRRNQPSCQNHHQVSSFISVFSNNQSTPIQQQQRQQPQQRTNTYNNNNTNNHHQQNFERKKVSFDPIFYVLCRIVSIFGSQEPTPTNKSTSNSRATSMVVQT